MTSDDLRSDRLPGELLLKEQRLADGDEQRAREDEVLSVQEQAIADAEQRADDERAEPGEAFITRAAERLRLSQARDRTSAARDRASDERDRIATQRDADATIQERIQERMQRDALPVNHELIAEAQRMQLRVAAARESEAQRRQRAAASRLVAAEQRAAAAEQRAEAMRRRVANSIGQEPGGPPAGA